MKEYVIMTLILLPIEKTFKVNSELSFLPVKVSHCDVEVDTIYYDPPVNKHEITIGNERLQYVGHICPATDRQLKIGGTD